MWAPVLLPCLPYSLAWAPPLRPPLPDCPYILPCAVQILNSTSVPYVTVNVLEDELLRSGGCQDGGWVCVWVGGGASRPGAAPSDAHTGGCSHT